MEKNLGHATAYGYAKSKGYSGTEEEFAELMADYASVGQSAAQSAEQAAASATSASGSATTASQAAQTATSKASEAVTAASTATTKASEASQSASTASTAKTDAESARDAAAQSASEAAESARTLTIDATLTQSGQAADAKAVGDDIDSLKSAFDELNALSYNLLSGAAWVVGQVSPTTGADSWSDAKIRTEYIPIPTGAQSMTLSCDSGWKFSAYIINDEKNLVTSAINWSINSVTVDLTTLATGNKGYFRYVLQRTDNTINLADYSHAHTVYSTLLTQSIADCTNNIVVVSASDISVYFAAGGNPTISDLDYSIITVTLTDKDLIIYDNVGENNFTPAKILSAAAAFGLTADSTARTFSGASFRFVYNYKNRTIAFKDPYAKIGQYEINLLTRMYTSLISGVIYDIITNKKTETNDSDIKEIQSEVFPQVPSYYDTQLATVKTSVESDLQTVGRHGDNFVFITDIHWSGNFKHSPGLIKSLAQGKMVNLIVNGGDLIDGTTDKALELARQIACVDAFNDAEIPMITAKGNHDLNSGYGTSANYFTENEYFATAQHRNALEGMVYGGDCYFYWDKLSTNTRYIVLDSGANNIGDGIEIPAAQTAWIASIIENTPSNMHIIVVVHALGAYQSTVNPVGDGNQFVYCTGAQELLDALDALLPTHKIEAVFFGHTHYDANYSTNGGIPLVSTNSDAIHQYYGMTQPPDGTVNAQCFDVVTIDYVAKKIYMRRIGRGADRVISY